MRVVIDRSAEESAPEKRARIDCGAATGRLVFELDPPLGPGGADRPIQQGRTGQGDSNHAAGARVGTIGSIQADSHGPGVGGGVDQDLVAERPLFGMEDHVDSGPDVDVGKLVVGFEIRRPPGRIAAEKGAGAGRPPSARFNPGRRRRGLEPQAQGAR